MSIAIDKHIRYAPWVNAIMGCGFYIAVNKLLSSFLFYQYIFVDLRIIYNRMWQTGNNVVSTIYTWPEAVPIQPMERKFQLQIPPASGLIRVGNTSD